MYATYQQDIGVLSMEDPVLVPSFKSSVPSFEPKSLGPHDVAVEFGGDWYLIGEMAQTENSVAERMQHGDFSSIEIQLLTKAAVAKAVGKNAEIETNIALAAPLKSINNFRVGPGETRLKDDQYQFLKDTLSEIRFRTDSTHGEIKTVKCKINDAKVLNELQSVYEIIPDSYIKYGLIQWGHGDLQAVAVNEGKVIGEPFFAAGLWSALRQFQKITKLPPSEAQRAFISGYRYNGSMKDKISCKAEITQAIQHHVLTDHAPLLNSLAKLDQSNAIVSGGSIKKSEAFDILYRECQGRGIKLHKINDLEGIDVDPVFTCLAGLRKFGKIRLDIGHSSLKSEWEY